MTRFRAINLEALCQLQVVHDLDQMRDLQVLQAQDGRWGLYMGELGHWMTHFKVNTMSNLRHESEMCFVGVAISREP